MNENGVVGRFFGALDAHDPEALRGLLSPDFVFEEVAGAGERSVDALTHEMGMVFAAFPDILFRPVRRSLEGNRVYAEFRAFGTHQAEFLNVPATGAVAVFSGVFNLEVDDEMVRRLRMTVDFGGLRRQLLLAARHA